MLWWISAMVFAEICEDVYSEVICIGRTSADIGRKAGSRCKLEYPMLEKGTSSGQL